MKVVIDTNVLVSGLINPNGTPAKIINLLINEKITILYDNRIIMEYEQVLLRKKFGFKEEIINPVLDFIRNDGIFIVPEPLQINFTDEDDKMFFEVAKTGNAEYLITGNTNHFPKEKLIITPKIFLDKYI